MTKTDENIRKVATVQGDNYTTGCLLDYTYFKKFYKMIAVDLSKQQALDADPKAIQQTNFTANLDRAGNKWIYFILKEAKETVFEFSQETAKVLEVRFCWISLILINIKMTKCNSLNVKLSNSQLNKFKSAIRNETKVVLRLSSNMISDNETNFPHQLLLSNRQVAIFVKLLQIIHR